MKTKLRILFTPDCNRRCKGCCNRNWTGEPPVEMSVEQIRAYDEIYITGGEPMLYPKELLEFIKGVRTDTNKVFLYTAKPFPKADFLNIVKHLDGVTLTLHSYADRKAFMDAMYHITPFPKKSMRLNAFKGQVMPFRNGSGWKYRQMTWITDAPLPDGEVFGVWNTKWF